MNIVSRAEWGARYGQGYATAGAKLYYFVHHSGARILTPASSIQQEMAEWRRIEEFHAQDLTRKNPRIAYTHGLAPSGRTFVGTDWGKVGAHTENWNSKGYAVCIMDDGERNSPGPIVIQALNELRIIGMREGHLHLQHRLRGHRDTKATACPGDNIYDVTVRISEVGVWKPTSTDEARALPSLRRGSSGPAVRFLQDSFVRMGRMTQAQIDTGYGHFGPKTEDAVFKLQRDNALKEDGIVGVKTWPFIRF